MVCGVATPAEAEANVGLLELDIPMDLWRGFKEAGLLGGSVPIVQHSPSTVASL